MAKCHATTCQGEHWIAVKRSTLNGLEMQASHDESSANDSCMVTQ